MTKENRYEFIGLVKNVLDKAGIEFWLDCGTLLGVYRDKDLIEWDHDIDLSTTIDNRDKISGLSKELGEIGRFGEVWLTSLTNKRFLASHYIIKNSYKLDIYYWWKVRDKIIAPVGSHMVNVMSDKYLLLKQIKFKGMKLKIPKYTEQFLEDRFGEDWRFPNPSWKDTQQKSLGSLKTYSKHFN